MINENIFPEDFQDNENEDDEDFGASIYRNYENEDDEEDRTELEF